MQHVRGGLPNYDMPWGHDVIHTGEEKKQCPRVTRQDVVKTEIADPTGDSADHIKLRVFRN